MPEVTFNPRFGTVYEDGSALWYSDQEGWRDPRYGRPANPHLWLRMDRTMYANLIEAVGRDNLPRMAPEHVILSEV